jgi:hypothetical protein
VLLSYTRIFDMRRALALLVALVAAAVGCDGLPRWDVRALLPEKRLDSDILGRSVTVLAGEGQTYPDTAPGTVGRSWKANLERLGLTAEIDDDHCVRSVTPDGHKFSVNVFTQTDLMGQSDGKTRAYLHWNERDYGTQGWQVLTDLEGKRLGGARQ